jgi:hypothetical protein
VTADDFEVDVTGGTLRCGYCGELCHWAGTATGYHRLTGDYLLGVGHEKGDVVVLAEAEKVTGGTTYLPHLCPSIPDGVLAKYADEVAELRRGVTP